MNNEMKSMKVNEVWDLIELPIEIKLVGHRWVFKIRTNSKENIDKLKVRLIAKGFTTRKCTF
jgi:Reverse transcriptase (RNA-dependent DNA polymerase)